LLGLLSALVLIPARSAHAASACSACPGDLNNNDQVTIDEILTVVNAALTGCPPAGPSLSSLLQTGQTACDQGDGTLGACPGSPPDQDGAVGAGIPPNYTDNGDGTIADKVTGLIWEKLSNDGMIHDWTNTYTWYDAFNVKIAALNTPPCFADHCDWRLPNRRELDSLVDTGRAPPAIDPVFNAGCTPGCTVTTCSCTQLMRSYWSSTTYQDRPTFAWSVDGNVGIVNAFEKSVVTQYVRAVRGGL
ncbi:MAG TPA: DUF1566 domain-containing protein, partial [Candidatus Acidoferrales bacterium]|nr:DUF1566 domain-containing protein [Candidatus Acidoferrales bacterium]